MDILLVSTRVDRFYSWFGLHVRTRWPTAAMAEAGHEVLNHFGLSPEELPAAEPDLSLDWLDRKAEVPLPVGAEEIVRHISGVRLHKVGEQVVVSRGASRVRIGADSGGLTGSISAEAQQHEEALRRELYLLLTFSLVLLMQQRSFYAVHAAGLCRNAEEGLLLVAESDSGKSTMSMSLVRQGWRFLSDDSLLLQPGKGAVAALPFRRDFGLDPDAAVLFPELETTHRAQIADPEKWRVDAEALYPGQKVARCLPKVMVFPQIVDQPASRLVPVGRTEAILHVMRQSSFLDPDPARAAAHLDVIKQLVQQARSYLLLAGEDIKYHPAQLSRMLSDLF